VQGVKIRKESFGYLVFVPLTMAVYELNEDGQQILRECNGENNLKDIASKLGYHSQEMNDLGAFLQDLSQRQVVEMT